MPHLPSMNTLRHRCRRADPTTSTRSARAAAADDDERPRLAAGVSLKTVSRVINGEPGVTPATLSKVEAAIEALGYARNDLAASLRSGVSSNTIGLVIEDVANPSTRWWRRPSRTSRASTASLLITTSAREDPARERELVTALLRRRVDALLIVPGRPGPPLHRAGRLRGPHRLPRPPAGADRRGHRADRQRRRRAARGHAPAAPGPSPDRDRRRHAGALHGR